MRVLLDEAVPQQLLMPLQHLTRGQHQISHVLDVKLGGRKDPLLLGAAAKLGFEVFVTNDSSQLDDPEETRAIRRSRLHHVRYSQRMSGRRGLGLALGVLIGELPLVLDELADIEGQRLVRVHGVDHTRRRFDVLDPVEKPPRYWGRKPPKRSAAGRSKSGA